jgi:hypothetical protein
MDFEMETALDSINIKVHRCPIYHGLSMAGFGNSVINQFCHSGGGGEYAAITSVFPKLEPYAVPRKSADDVCIEGYKIKK